MMLGDTYINLSLVSVVVFEDPTTITVYYAAGSNESTQFHTGASTDQIDRLREILDDPRSREFQRLRGGKEYLNLQWVIRAQHESTRGEMTVSIPQGGNRAYAGEDARVLAMRFM
jgi:hypothetical protein